MPERIINKVGRYLSGIGISHEEVGEGHLKFRMDWKNFKRFTAAVVIAEPSARNELLRAARIDPSQAKIEPVRKSKEQRPLFEDKLVELLGRNAGVPSERIDVKFLKDSEAGLRRKILGLRIGRKRSILEGEIHIKEKRGS